MAKNYSIQAPLSSIGLELCLDGGWSGGYLLFVKRSLYFLIAVLLIANSVTLGAEEASPKRLNNNIERIKALLTSQGIGFQERPLFSSQGGFGSSLHIDFPSMERGSASEKSVTLAIPYNDQLVTEQLSFSLQTALALASKVKNKPINVELRIALLADEKASLPEGLRGTQLRGSRDLSQRYEDPESVLVVYLDLEDSAQGLSLVHGAGGTVLPLEYLQNLLISFSQQGYSLNPALPYNELYRLDLISGPIELSFFNKLGFSSLLISETSTAKDAVAKETELTQDLSSDELADILYEFIAKVQTMNRTEDRHYTLFAIGKRTLPLSEVLSIGLFGLAAMLAMLYIFIFSLTHRHLLGARLKLFLRWFWVLPFFLIVLFLCLRSAFFLFDLILSFAKAQPKQDEYGALALILLLAISIYFLFSPLFSKKPFPRRAHYYGSAAVLILAIGALIAAPLDFTFVPIFLWAFSFSVVAAILPVAELASIFALLAPLQLIGSALACIGSGETNPARYALSGNLKFEFVLAFLILPFLFLFRRSLILFRMRSKKTPMRIKFSLLHYLPRLLFFAGILFACFSYAYTNYPANKPPKENLMLEERNEPSLSLNLISKNFLDQKTVDIQIQGEQNPLRYDVSLVSPIPFALYDASAPYHQSSDGKVFSFNLGENPKNPLDISVTLPASFSGQIQIACIYKNPDKAGFFYVTRTKAEIDASQVPGK